MFTKIGLTKESNRLVRRKSARGLIYAALMALFSTSCSAILDFDDVNNLPCPCDTDHVCLASSNRCVEKQSVDDFKSCSQENASPDDLCKTDSICQAVNGNGPRCLPKCTPTNYVTEEAISSISSECPQGTTCWSTERGGVCDVGVCDELQNKCGIGNSCVRFNAAGVCFTGCQIFQQDPLPCAGDQACHPIGASAATACLNTGSAKLGEPCSDALMCEKMDNGGRALVCARPLNSPEDVIRRCLAVCVFGDDARCDVDETCVLFRQRVDATSDLGICAIRSG